MDERRHGKWTLYLENGNCSSIASFKHGLKHGEWVMYDEDGSIVCRMFYKNGKKSGTWELYKNGELAQQRIYWLTKVFNKSTLTSSRITIKPSFDKMVSLL